MMLEPARSPESPAVRPAWWRTVWLPVLLAGAALAALFDRVGLSNLGVGAIGGDIDGYNNIWNYYWLKTALLDLHQNPFYTDYIYYPSGASLRFHTFNPLNGLLTLPFNDWLGYIPVFNLLFFVAPLLTLVCSFLFLRDIVGNQWAAFAGAVVLTYADYHIAVFLTTGQSSYITLWWMPLYLFLLFRCLHGVPVWENGAVVSRDTRRWWLYGILAILALLCASLTDWQYLMLVVFATLLYGAVVLLWRRPLREKAQLLGKMAAIGGIYGAIVALPLILPMLAEAHDNPWLDVSYQSDLHSVDLATLLNPGIGLHGLVILAVAAIGAVFALRQRNREIAAFWLLSVGFFYLMSLGPTLLLNGSDTNFPMPYSLLQKLPLISSARDPARWTLIATIGVAVLFAWGVRALIELVERHSARRGLVVALPLVAVLLALPVAAMAGASSAVPVATPDFPEFYKQLAADPESYAILELPLFNDDGRGADHYQMYQILHHKLRYSGRLARDRKLDNPNNFVKRSSLFRYLWALDFPPQREQDEHPDDDFLARTDLAALGLPILNYYDTRYIVIYKEALSDDNMARMEDAVHLILGTGAQPSYEDKLTRVYSVPQAPPPTTTLTLDTGEGWYPRETAPDGNSFRWADNRLIISKSGYVITPTAELYSMNLTEQPAPATLNFTAYPYKQARTLNLRLNGQIVWTDTLRPEDGARRFSVEITLPPGNNFIEFVSPDPPLPTDNPQADARKLSFAMQQISLERR